jgi:hypothetical protein
MHGFAQVISGSKPDLMMTPAPTALIAAVKTSCRSTALQQVAVHATCVHLLAGCNRAEQNQ